MYNIHVIINLKLINYETNNETNKTVDFQRKIHSDVTFSTISAIFLCVSAS